MPTIRPRSVAPRFKADRRTSISRARPTKREKPRARASSIWSRAGSSPRSSKADTGYVGRILDTVEAAGVRDSTIVIFTSDNGPEYIKPWDGWAGPWRGQYFTALEGGIRAPFLIRWPGRIAAEGVSNEIVHGADMFATLARIGGAKSAHRPAVRQYRSVGLRPRCRGEISA
jgi:membrane-anchored protein YejM (alkaline phosphatase superfamily)